MRFHSESRTLGRRTPTRTGEMVSALGTTLSATTVDNWVSAMRPRRARPPRVSAAHDFGACHSSVLGASVLGSIWPQVIAREHQRALGRMNHEGEDCG